jgi:hypothetical protein
VQIPNKIRRKPPILVRLAEVFLWAIPDNQLHYKNFGDLE